MNEPRTPSDVDALADQFLAEEIALNPIQATYVGIAGYDDQLPDLTPEWFQSISELRRRTLAALEAATPVDTSDRITVAALRSLNAETSDDSGAAGRGTAETLIGSAK